MTTKTGKFAVATLFILFVISNAVAEPRDWAFVQSVGGVALSKPTKTDGAWALPVRSNLTGLEAITNAPTVINSALVCAKAEAQIHFKEIFITISSDIPNGKFTASCPPAPLGAIAPGQYRVYYHGPRDVPHFLDELTIGN